jgi:hypothetical protein
MNPLAHAKCARRLLMALAAISGIFLAVGCGSSSSSSTNPVGFSNSSLKGTYVFSSTGTDSESSSFLALAGAITADGNGNITAGNVDVVDFNAGFASGSATGTYGVGTDGRGQFTVSVTGAQNFTFDFVLSSTSHGLVSEFDSFGTGSGTMDLQTPLTGISQLANSYALSLAGDDINDSFPIASAGSVTFSSSGVITAGIQDFNEDGIPVLGTAPTGTATLGTGLAPGSIVLNDALGGDSTFDFYPVDSTHFKVIETDLTNGLLAGDFYTQANANIPSGAVVFTMAGGTDSSGPTVVGGYATTDIHGNFTAGSEDINQGGAFVTSIPFTGLAGSAGVGGRVVVTLTGSPASTWVLYPTTGFGLVILEADTANVTLGAAYAQSATSFPASQNYGFNLTGINIGAEVEVDDIAQFAAASATASPNMTGLIDENASGSFARSLSFSATYTPDSGTTGRGNILAPTLGTVNGGLSLEYYVVDGTTTLFIEGGNGDNQQIAEGSFVQQTAPTSGALKHPVVALPHATNHAHGAAKPPHKWTPQSK